MTRPLPAIVVVAKAPEPGRVKTRLVPPLTPAEAADLAEAALADTLAAAVRCRAGRRVLVLDGPVGPWLPPGVEVFPQRGAGLAARLQAVWDDVGGPALQIGMDTPQVTADLLDDCLDVLAHPEVDAALGPATDGGWWALALQRCHQGLFDGIPMSSSDTGRAQVERLAELGLRTRTLPTLRDVDTATDAAAVARQAPGTRFAGLVERVLPAAEVWR